MEFVTLTNDVAELSGVVNLTSADVTSDTDGRDCSFKINVGVLSVNSKIIYFIKNDKTFLAFA